MTDTPLMDYAVATGEPAACGKRLERQLYKAMDELKQLKSDLATAKAILRKLSECDALRDDIELSPAEPATKATSQYHQYHQYHQ